MISAKKIEKIYNSLINKEIDKNDAINQLIVSIIKYPQFYGLEKLDKEILHEIIETLLIKIDSVLKNYDKSRNSKFTTYFQMYVRFIYQSWKKKFVKEKIKNTIIHNLNTKELYEREEENLFNPERNLESLINDSNNSINYSGENNKTYNRKELDIEFLIIALKSSYIISEGQINEISKIAKISINELTKLIEKVNKKLSYRKNQKTILEGRINKDFFKLQEIKMKISLNDNDIIEKEMLEKKFNRIKKRRDSNISKLNSIKLVPSDKDIGDILNVSPAKVRYYLRKNYRIYNIKSTNPRSANKKCL